MNEVVIHPYIRFDSSRVSHAYIVTGVIADTLAMAVVCTARGERPCMTCAHCNKSSRGIHPDITQVNKQENTHVIGIEQIREIRRDALVYPNESDKKAYVINEADLMNINAQNAFLRILEEPPSFTVFILKTETPDTLLPTVRSRCVEIRSIVAQEEPDDAGIEMVERFFSAIHAGNAALAAFMFQLEKLNREQFTKFLNLSRERAALELRKIADNRVITPHGLYICTESAAESVNNPLKSSEYLSRVERVLYEAYDYLNLNVSAGHISGLICAALLECENQ